MARTVLWDLGAGPDVALYRRTPSLQTKQTILFCYLHLLLESVKERWEAYRYIYFYFYYDGLVINC